MNGSIKTKTNERPEDNWTSNQKFYVYIIKPAIDYFFSFLGLIIFSPLFFIVSVAIILESRGHILFRQQRVGKDCVVFEILKFRSMKIPPSSGGIIPKDIERVTKVGTVIRKTSLDELPQLFNIVIGKMSFIGPRPLPVKYLPFFNEKEIKRHSIKPGISGLAQVNGRNKLNWSKKFEDDLEYLRTISLSSDIKIFLLTFIKLLKTKDILLRGENSVIDFDKYRLEQNKSKEQLLNQGALD